MYLVFVICIIGSRQRSGPLLATFGQTKTHTMIYVLGESMTFAIHIEHGIEIICSHNRFDIFFFFY